jgi:hypothetical protein
VPGSCARKARYDAIDTLLGETVALRTARLVVEREPVLVLPMHKLCNKELWNLPWR